MRVALLVALLAFAAPAQALPADAPDVPHLLRLTECLADGGTSVEHRVFEYNGEDIAVDVCMQDKQPRYHEIHEYSTPLPVHVA